LDDAAFGLRCWHAQRCNRADDAAFGLDPGANLAGCPWQRLGDPGCQFVLPHIAQAAGAAFVAKAARPSMPSCRYSRCEVSSSRKSTLAIAPQLITFQQQRGIGPPRQSVSHRPISGQFNQVAARFSVKEVTANHSMTRVAAGPIRKRGTWVSKGSGL
jgi:hypothetical protein